MMRVDVVELVTSIPSSLESEWLAARAADPALRFTDWVVAKYKRNTKNQHG